MYYQNSYWFIHYKINKIDPKLALFCFHHAGGTAAFFRDWGKILPPEVELVAVQLPGRETRNSQPFITDIDNIAKQIADSFHKYQHIPFMFFGHSLGSIIAFEVIHKLRSYYLDLPKYLIVSGRNAPQIPSRNEILHNLPDELFIEGLMKYQGMADEILQNKELLKILLPRIRADFTLSETYKYEKKLPLDCPILAIGGSNDPTVSYEDLMAWKLQTVKNFSINLFPGEHFFLNTSKKEVHSIILHTIQEVLNARIKT